MNTASHGPFMSSNDVDSDQYYEIEARANALASVEMECLDLAAVLIRLARSLRNNETRSRSVK
jgi:hypothetical protein